MGSNFHLTESWQKLDPMWRTTRQVVETVPDDARFDSVVVNGSFLVFMYIAGYDTYFKYVNSEGRTISIVKETYESLYRCTVPPEGTGEAVR